MSMVVRAFPVLKGKLPRLKELAQRMNTDRAVAGQAFYRRHGVARESGHPQQLGPDHWVLIAATEIPEKPVEVAAADYAKSTEAFDRWFKQEVLATTGIDPDREPLGPRTECIFDSAAAD